MGLKPNLQPGKTEIVVAIRGKQKVATQQFLHGPCQSCITIPSMSDDLCTLRVVPHYTHLGGLISHGGRLRGEIRRRLGVARQSFQALSSKVFYNAKVGLQTRLSIFRATVWLSLTYNVGTWSELSPSELRIWHCGVLRLYRQLLRKLYPAEVVRHFTEDQSLSLTGLPEPLTAIRICRLRHFAQVLSRGNPFFWALVAEEQSWLTAVQLDFAWLYSNIQGLTCLPPPDQDPVAWHDLILQHLPRWKGLLKRVATHAGLVSIIRADVRTFHRQLLVIAFDAGLRHRQTTPTTDNSTNEAHVCWICQRSFASLTAWGSHSFKAHGRTNACRHLAQGSLCHACGKQYPSHERLVRHLRTHPPCRDTLATSRSFVEAQPYYGSTTVQQRVPADSMKTWLPTTTSTVPPGHGWPMTAAMWEGLRILSALDWDELSSERLPKVLADLQQHPIHFREISHLLDANQQFYQDRPRACDLLASFRSLILEAFQVVPNPTPPVVKPPLEWLDDMDALDFMPSPSPHRCTPRFLYVVHLFSGTKRAGDLHSYVASLPALDGSIFCPISVDVVLDETICDLMSIKQQRQWIDLAKRGILFMVAAGPPCETWSVARLRFLETLSGPRPLRSSDCESSLWCKAPLRIRELRQVHVGNALLQFTLTLMMIQASVANVGLMEHPSASNWRYNCLPPSVWRLRALQLLLMHRNCGLHFIQQGFYGQLAPKPTTLLVICPPSLRSVMQLTLDEGRTCSILPPAVKMGQISAQGYSTAPLKRYPPGLCRTIAQMALRASICASPCGLVEDGLWETAAHLEKMYTMVSHSADGQDYFKGPTTHN